MMDVRNIVITGARGGIGQELVLEALKRWPQATVFAISRPKDPSIDTYKDHSRVSLIEGDLTDPLSVKEIAAELARKTSQIDLGIHTLGILNGKSKRPEKSLGEIDAEAMMEAFQVNAMSAIHLGQILKPFFRNKDHSVLMFLSAKVGSIGDNQLGGWYSYRMSKAALNMGVRTLALEYQRSGCEGIVIAVHPGTTRTPFTADYVKSWPDEKLADPHVTAERLLDLALQLTPASSGTFVHWDGTILPW